MPYSDPGKTKEYAKDYYAKNREYLRERGRENYKENSVKRNEKSRKYYADNREKCLEDCREYALNKIGWTPGMFETTLREQGNRCAVCRLPIARPCADHKHVSPPEPRGILCHNCNTAIGHLRENPDIIRAAADYVEAWA